MAQPPPPPDSLAVPGMKVYLAAITSQVSSSKKVPTKIVHQVNYLVGQPSEEGKQRDFQISLQQDKRQEAFWTQAEASMWPRAEAAWMTYGHNHQHLATT